MSAFGQALDLLPDRADTCPATPLFSDYQRLLPALEAALWADPGEWRLSHFQAFCREMEAAVTADIAARRHHIVVVVPVADRPRQLAACIESLVACQAAFGYSGGVSLVVAEDSAEPAHRDAHRRLVTTVSGLDGHYLGLDEQRALLEDLARRDPDPVAAFAGNEWHAQMGRKGASVTRNIAMLWLAQQSFERPLFHFIDSDQAFHVDVGARRPRYMLNYFHHLDRLFREHDIEVLTGKVVGDPPVSPAVMAGTLLGDVNTVLAEALPNYREPCGFHRTTGMLAHGAYHDMAAMFGLDNEPDDWRYGCPLLGEHTYGDALRAFSERLPRFFEGEHPTRLTRFKYVPVGESLSPARTVYTGNYVLNAKGLRHCIPFAPLRLRMAGPTLGRLLHRQLGARFVQANLPLLHQRTEEKSGRSEFRPGVVRQAGQVDLSGEYERQFIGDWMLFSMIELIGRSYPENADDALIEQVLAQVEQRLLDEYAATRARVLERLQGMEGLLDEADALWHANESMYATSVNLRAFAASIHRNFSMRSRAVERLADAAWRATWRARLLQALDAFPNSSRDWEALLEKHLGT